MAARDPEAHVGTYGNLLMFDQGTYLDLLMLDQLRLRMNQQGTLPAQSNSWDWSTWIWENHLGTIQGSNR